MNVLLLQDTVIDGSVYWAGTTVETDWTTAHALERKLIVERADEADWKDTMEHFYPERQAAALSTAGAVMDVLVFTPVLRLEPETVQAVLGLEWDGAITFEFQRDNPISAQDDPGKKGIENHLHQYTRGRETFLAGRYDAMLVVESDIIPPPDTLKKLAALNVDCAYGVYRFRSVDVISINERYPAGNTNLGSNLSYERYLLKRAMKLGQYPCTGGGLGCVLIRRRVLEAIEFRIEDLFTAHCDTFFCQDVLRAGFSQAADMSVVCGHKTPEGEILWPNLDWRTA